MGLNPMAEAPAAEPSGLDMIASSLQRKAPQLMTPQPTSIGAEAVSGNENNGAAQLMASLLDDRRKRYGVSLSGIA